jgi:hypothetical protein
VLESDGVLALLGEPLVEQVQHLEEGGVRADAFEPVAHETAPVGPVLLPPDMEGQVHQR